MAENEAEIIAEEKKQLVLNGRSFLIGKLSLGQSISLLRKLGKIFSVMAVMKGKIEEGMSNAQAVSVLLDNLSDDEISEIIAIMLKSDDLAFVKSIDAEQAMDVIIAVCEKNDLSKLLKKAQAAMEKMSSALASQKS